MDALTQLGEQRITDAIAAGEFDDLAGLGLPLELEDLSLVPEDLRASYVLLRGAGFLPEEMALRKEVLTLGGLVAACAVGRERDRLRERREAVRLRHRWLMERRGLPSVVDPWLPES
jgi:hypothetical protein